MVCPKCKQSILGRWGWEKDVSCLVCGYRIVNPDSPLETFQHTVRVTPSRRAGHFVGGQFEA